MKLKNTIKNIIDKREFARDYENMTLEKLAEKYMASIPTIRRLGADCGFKKKPAKFGNGGGNTRFILSGE